MADIVVMRYEANIIIMGDTVMDVLEFITVPCRSFMVRSTRQYTDIIQLIMADFVTYALFSTGIIAGDGKGNQLKIFNGSFDGKSLFLSGTTDKPKHIVKNKFAQPNNCTYFCY